MSNTTTADSSCTSGAIQVAADYTNNSKADWHLPSKNELAQLYAQRTTVGGFSSASYWSSSESAGNAAWYQSFYDGGLTQEAVKGNTYYVRPVRAFSSSCANGGACALGDIGPGGGKVFYVHASGTFACGATLASTCKYLEAAPTSGTAAWTDMGFAWSYRTTSGIGTNARGIAIGAGYKNTEAIVTQNAGVAVGAGALTRGYRGPNNLSDWYLPAAEELQALYNQRTTVGASTDGYWSSTETGATTAFTRDFYLGDPYSRSKNLSFNVRPVRAFG
jgi:hypothetical protein